MTGNHDARYTHAVDDRSPVSQLRSLGVRGHWHLAQRGKRYPGTVVSLNPTPDQLVAERGLLLILPLHLLSIQYTPESAEIAC